MTNSKNTKRALLSSVLALLVCVTMLIGTTFAWFTDNVTSVGNKIVSGNLDIDLYLWNDADTSVEITDESDPIFGSAGLAQNSTNTLWEPGKTQVVYLSLKNNGSLDLKYKVGVDVENPANSKNLYEVMQYAITNDAKYGEVTSWTSGNEVVEGINTTAANDVVLGAGDEHFFALSIHMEESAGNEYMNGQVNFDIKVLATQLNSEEDSFGKDYDAFADYDGEISNAASLISALNAGGTYKVLNGFAMDETAEIPAGVEVNLDLSGNTVEGNIEIAEGGSLNVQNGAIENTDNSVSGIQNNGGELVLNNVTINSARHGVRVEGGNVTIDGGTYKVVPNSPKTQHALNVSDGATVTVNGGTFIGPKGTEADSGSAVNVQAGSTVIINGGNFSGGKLNTLTAKGTLIVKGGTFDQDPSAYVANGYVATQNDDGTYTVIEGVKVNNATELADVLKSDATEINVVLADGEYNNVLTASNKTINIKGSKNAVISITNGLSTSHDHMGLTNCNVTLENVTVKFEDGAYYAAYINNPTMTYIKCTIIGQQYIYGNTTFIKCVFDNDDDAAKSAMRYTYIYDGDVVVDDCDFYTQGHALIMYSDHGGGGNHTLTVKNSRFHGGDGRTAGAVAGQNTAAIEIDGSCGADYTLNLEGNNTFDGGFSGLWRIKAMKSGVITTVNGVEYIGDTSDVYLDGIHYIKDASNKVTQAN